MTSERRPHPDTESLRRGIDRCLPCITVYSGSMCRVVSMKYATSKDLLTGEGAMIHGGRWNPPGLIRAVYGSLDPYAALSETIGAYGEYAIPFHQLMPLVMVAIEVRLRRVLDLTDGAQRKRLGVSERRMLEEDWQEAQSEGSESLTQAIGKIACESGIEALLVRSKKFSKEKNLVVFPENLDATSRMKILNRHKLE